MIQYFGINQKGRDFFCGDIHGSFGLLGIELAKVFFDERYDRVFATGDLVDRGPNSIEALEYLEKPWFHSVRGNHDHCAVRYPQGNMLMDNYSANGGQWMIDLPIEDQLRVSASLDKLPYMIEVLTTYGKIGVAHAEIPKDDWELCKQDLGNKYVRATLMWSRNNLKVLEHTDFYPKIQNIDIAVVGHTPFLVPTLISNVFHIDTGCGKTGYLSLIESRDLFSRLGL